MKMNKQKAVNILKKVYHHTNVDHDTKYFDRVGYKTDWLTQEQHLLLKEAELIPNDFVKLTHDNTLKKFLEIKSSKKISKKFAVALFIKSLSGNAPRFRQTLMSFWYLQQLEEHKFEKVKNNTTCANCGLIENVVMDKTHNLFTYYLGHSWNECPEHFLTEIEEITDYSKPEILEEDTERLIYLLQEINKAEPNETPGQLEKRIAKSKLLPKTDKYKRYGILQTLAVIGVLPSNSHLNNQPIRSDITMPLAGWKGKLGVNFEKAAEIFEIEIPKNI